MDLTQERQIKHQRICAYLDETGLDAVLLGRRCNFSWYTCGAGRNYVGTACDVGGSWLLVGKDSAVVIADNIEATRLTVEDLPETGIELVSYHWFDPAAQQQAIAQVTKGLNLAADTGLTGVDAQLLGSDFDKLRWALTDSEIGRYRQVCDETAAAVEAAVRSAEQGWSENQLIGRVSSELVSRDLPPWVLLVGADERAERFRHPLPTDMPMQRFFMVAACGERGGLIASVTRMASFGAVPGELSDKHEATASVTAALAGATRPKATLGEMFSEAVAAYEAAGWADQWRLHHQGGPCGYQGREVKATPDDSTLALAGQAFAWNPSIAGTKIEQMILCGEGGPETMSKPTDWPSLEGTWQGYRLDCADILEL